MKKIYLFPLLVATVMMFSCGGAEDAKKQVENKVEDVKAKVEVVKEEVAEVVEEVKEVASTLTNVGVGTVKELKFEGDVDEVLAKKGEDLFTSKGCNACHNPTMRIVGPAIEGLFERRNAAWVMNMIMNPEVMVKEDADAKALLEEYNNIPMTNQDVSEEDARAIVEYFRTI